LTNHLTCYDSQHRRRARCAGSYLIIILHFYIYFTNSALRINKRPLSVLLFDAENITAKNIIPKDIIATLFGLGLIFSRMKHLAMVQASALKIGFSAGFPLELGPFVYLYQVKVE